MAGNEAFEGLLEQAVEGLFRLLLDDHQLQTAQLDLTAVQARALKLVQAEPLPTSRLAAALGISAPAVTQLTDRLARKKLIERQAAVNDRRSVIVVITERGGRVIDMFRQRRNEVFAEMLSRLTERDRGEVIAALSKIAAVLDGSGTTEFRRTAIPVPGIRVGVVTRTAKRSVQTSKDVGREPVTRPMKRMKIEWD